MTAKWIRSKTGNTALGILVSDVTGRILDQNISLSYARMIYSKYIIYEGTW